MSHPAKLHDLKICLFVYCPFILGRTETKLAECDLNLQRARYRTLLWAVPLHIFVFRCASHLGVVRLQDLQSQGCGFESLANC